MTTMSLDQEELLNALDVDENLMSSEPVNKRSSLIKCEQSKSLYSASRPIEHKVYVSLFVCVGLLLWTVVVVLKIQHKLFRKKT